MNINLKKGDIINTVIFGIAVVKDVMKSVEGDATTIYVQFVNSIGRTHPDGDALKITPDKMRDVDKWQPATIDDLLAAIDERRKAMELKFQAVVEMTQNMVNGNN